MKVQSRNDLSNRSAILDGSLTASSIIGIIKQDGGRATPLLPYTLLAKVAATGKLTPFISEVAVDGTALPSAIYMGAEISAADIVAGDVEDQIVLLGGNVYFDRSKLVIEGGKLTTTVIAAASVNAKTVEDTLNERGIFLAESVETTSFENA